MQMGIELLALGRYDAAIQEGLKAINSGFGPPQSCRPRGLVRRGAQGGGEGRLPRPKLNPGSAMVGMLAGNLSIGRRVSVRP